MEIFLALTLGITLSAACGFRVFVPPFILSLAGIYGHFTLSSGFEWLGTTEAAIALGFATLLEISSYYIPFVDNLLDTVQIPLAVGIGTLITAATLGHTDPVLQWTLAVVAGGGTAGIVGSLAGFVRIASTGFTGGLGNFIVATAEAIGSISLSVVGITFPLATACGILAIILLGLLIFLFRRVNVTKSQL